MCIKNIKNFSTHVKGSVDKHQFSEDTVSIVQKYISHIDQSALYMEYIESLLTGKINEEEFVNNYNIDGSN